MTMTQTTQPKDVCYGPIAPGQFFIDRMNPQTPQIYKVTGVWDGIPDLFFCEHWGMNENRWVWSFGKYPHGGGYQVARCNLERMERVSGLAARLFAEQELRRRDDEWRARYDPTREPIKIIRCSCGIGDDLMNVSRHAVGCPMRIAD
jgi:hypothetical protein